VELNVRGRDICMFVKDAQHTLANNVKLPAGYYVEYGGEFENLQRAHKRLSIVVPIALAMIFRMLF
jgi:heavy metal efflux system protein